MTKLSIMPDHDPASILDYCFDWAPKTNGTPGGVTDWLESGETIASYVMTVEDGITISDDQKTNGNTAVAFMVEITPETGADPIKNYSVSCEITTDATPPRTDKRTIVIPVKYR